MKELKIELKVGGNGTAGSTTSQLYYPYGICIDVNNGLYVADQYNHRIQRFVSGSTTGVTICGTSGSAGSWSYQLNYPTSVTVDQFSNIFIMDAGNIRVQKWVYGAAYGTTIVPSGFSSPKGIALSPYSHIAVADQSYHRIVQFTVDCRMFIFLTLLIN